MMDADVIVIGGGPAGATAATLLARDGHRAVLFEKERFPRFHIGESLLPCDLPIFERLGFQPTEAEYVYKVGAEFIEEQSADFALYRFCDGLPGTPSHAWQVERSKFDAALLALSKEAGTELHMGCRVHEIDFAEDWVEVRADERTYRGRYLVDASGQHALLGRRDRTIRSIRGFGVAATFTHFRGLAESIDDELKKMGNIKVIMRPHGWIWTIPLPDRRLSVGVVSKDKGLNFQSVAEAIQDSPLLQRLTEGASCAGPSMIGNFSYLNEVPYGRRYACIGDAAAFLDPVFSSGVSLAMIGAEQLADRLSPALRERREEEPPLMQPLSSHMRRGYECFGSLIKSFYHTNLVKHLFFCPDPDLDSRAGLITMLAGDVWRDDNQFQNALLMGRRHWSPAEVGTSLFR